MNVYQGILWFCILSYFFFTSDTCKYFTTDMLHSSIEGKEMPKYFYKKMEGTIAGLDSITIELTKQDTLFFGKVYHKEQDKQLWIEGQLRRRTNEVILYESEENIGIVGVYKGVFSSNEKLEGLWIRESDNYAKAFSINNILGDDFKIQFSEFKKENCKLRDLHKNLPKEERFWYSDSCSYMNVVLIRFDSYDKSKTSKINELIEKSVYSGKRKTYNSLEEFVSSIQDLDRDYLGYDIIQRIITFENEILAIEEMRDEKVDGVHGYLNFKFHNFDLRNNTIIELDHILIPKYRQQLNRIGEQIFIQKYGPLDEWKFDQGNFELNNNFAITERGLLFIYYEYEIGTYSQGTPSVLIPFEEISDLIDPNGPLNRFLQNQNPSHDQ